MKFIHCPHCVAESGPMQYSVGVNDFGDLSITCGEHALRSGGPFAFFMNGTIAEDLLEMGGKPCEGCGETHAGKETGH